MASISTDPLNEANNLPVSLAIVVPMYNEGAGAERCVRLLCQQLTNLDHRSALIVVNDGSSDTTGDVLSRLKNEFVQLILLHHGSNRGYGAALMTGADRALRDGYDYVLFMDSDLTNDPNDIPKFVRKMQEGVDVIKGSRFLPDGRMAGVPLLRRSVSTLGNLVASALFRIGVKDCTNGFRAVKTRLLVKMQLHETGFPIIVEELYHCIFLAKTFSEVPVTLTTRSAAQRPTLFNYKPSVFFRYMKYAVLSFLRISPSENS